MSEFSFGGGTNIGNKRKTNEDSYKAAPSEGLWIVADGMGGAKGGEVASSIAVTDVLSYVQNNLPISDAILRAHHNIVNAASCNKDIEGMGSTIVALKCSNNTEYEIAWVGDSRAYLWDKTLSRLTQDHSYVQQLVKKGELDSENTWGHPKSNVITQALGMVNKDIHVDTTTGHWQSGQKILLCSDGLHGELKDSEIENIIRQGFPNQKTVDLLIEAALARGGKDNISVLLVSPTKPNTSIPNTSTYSNDDETIPYSKAQSSATSIHQSSKTIDRTSEAINRPSGTIKNDSPPPNKRSNKLIGKLVVLLILLGCLFLFLSSILGNTT